MTYLTKEDWSKYLLPKISDDKSFQDELVHSKKIHNIILQIIYQIFPKPKPTQNKLIQILLFSSIIYYNKYTLINDIKHKDLSKFDQIIICTSCLFLSFKALNKQIDIKLLSSKIKPCLMKLNNNKSLDIDVEEINDKIKEKEFDILLSIQFNANIDTPYDYLRSIKLYLLQKCQKDDNNDNSTNIDVSNIINKLNDYIKHCMLFPLYLYYTSYEIILGCLLLIKKDTNFNFINLDELIKSKNIDINIDMDNINQCALYISKLSNKIIEASKIIIEEKNKKESDNNKCGANLNFDILSIIKTNAMQFK
jgi:hypothetical protein